MLLVGIFVLRPLAPIRADATPAIWVYNPLSPTPASWATTVSLLFMWGAHSVNRRQVTVEGWG